MLLLSFYYLITNHIKMNIQYTCLNLEFNNKNGESKAHFSAGKYIQQYYDVVDSPTELHNTEEKAHQYAINNKFWKYIILPVYIR